MTNKLFKKKEYRKMRKLKYLAIKDDIFGADYKYYKSKREAQKDQTFLYDKLFRIKEVRE